MMGPYLQKRGIQQYLMSILLVVTATVLTGAVRPFFNGKAPLFFFTIAVVFSAGYGGIGTGLLATALSLGIAQFVFQDNVLVLAQFSLLVFAVVGVAITLVIGKLRGLNAALVQARNQLQVANNELKLANVQLSRHTADLSHTNQELQHFAYALAHDLRNPLRTVGALTELVVHNNAEKLDTSSKEFAGMIVTGVQRMESLIQSLLDYAAAVDSHEDQVSTDCNTVVRRVLQDLHFVIATSGAVVTVDPLPVVHVGESHLLQVFLNLIGNAIKYRGVQSPQIHISATPIRNDWLFAVQDNGMGLDMQHADDIFAMFKRLHPAAQYEGSGIGLALCKAVIQRYGGKIWVESAPDKGSTFRFTLPKAAAANAIVPKQVLKEQSLS